MLSRFVQNTLTEEDTLDGFFFDQGTERHQKGRC